MAVETVNEEVCDLPGRLLHARDELHNILSELEFYHEAIIALIETADGGILESDRQRTGFARAGKKILDAGQVLSETLGEILKSVRQEEGDEQPK